VLLLTAAVTGLQAVVPGLLGALQRTPAALSGEYWRLISPIIINRGGWKEITVNLLGLAVVGALVEGTWGRRPWPIFYLTGAIVGEGAGLAWRPYGAGSSVAICGLLGALAIWLLGRVEARAGRLCGAAILLGGLVLTGLRNLHGPPLLAGASVAGFMLWRARNRPE
jgi:rhomboid protease GluP